MSLIIIYTKPDCPLCAGLLAKLMVIQPELGFTLEPRDITAQSVWFEQYQFKIPVLVVNGREFPTPSPRLTPERLKGLLGPNLTS